MVEWKTRKRGSPRQKGLKFPVKASRQITLSEALKSSQRIRTKVRVFDFTKKGVNERFVRDSIRKLLKIGVRKIGIKPRKIDVIIEDDRDSGEQVTDSSGEVTIYLSGKDWRNRKFLAAALHELGHELFEAMFALKDMIQGKKLKKWTHYHKKALELDRDILKTLIKRSMVTVTEDWLTGEKMIAIQSHVGQQLYPYEWIKQLKK